MFEKKLHIENLENRKMMAGLDVVSVASQFAPIVTAQYVAPAQTNDVTYRHLANVIQEQVIETAKEWIINGEFIEKNPDKLQSEFIKDVAKGTAIHLAKEGYANVLDWNLEQVDAVVDAADLALNFITGVSPYGIWRLAVMSGEAARQSFMDLSWLSKTSQFNPRLPFLDPAKIFEDDLRDVVGGKTTAQRIADGLALEIDEFADFDPLDTGSANSTCEICNNRSDSQEADPDSDSKADDNTPSRSGRLDRHGIVDGGDEEEADGDDDDDDDDDDDGGGDDDDEKEEEEDEDDEEDDDGDDGEGDEGDDTADDDIPEWQGWYDPITREMTPLDSELPGNEEGGDIRHDRDSFRELFPHLAGTIFDAYTVVDVLENEDRTDTTSTLYDPVINPNPLREEIYDDSQSVAWSSLNGLGGGDADDPIAPTREEIVQQGKAEIKYRPNVNPTVVNPSPDGDDSTGGDEGGDVRPPRPSPF